jgi:capsular polysaccharide transport system permease protein
VELDEYAGLLVIKVQAYHPETSRAIVSLLVEEGELFMNAMSHRLAMEQVVFMEKQISQRHEASMQARQAVLDFQNQKGLVSPQATAENMAGIVARLESQRAELETRRSALQAFLVPDHPSIVQLDQQIEAVEKQINEEQARLTSIDGATLNRTVEEFQRLQLAADFALEIYKTALISLEKGRVEATRTIKKVSVLQAPTLPQYPQQPRRLYNIVVFVLSAMLLAGIIHLLAAIIRDHKD